MTRNFGWKRDEHDHRDELFRFLAPPVLRAPPMVNLRPLETTVFDQGQLGSCTANAIAKHLLTVMVIEKDPKPFPPSRLFIYFNERMIEGTVSEDAGAMIRDGIKSVAKQGVCPESEWTYDISRFASKPPDFCYTDAARHLVASYHRLGQGISDIRACLASGYPFVFGFEVFPEFESEAVAASGNVPLPKRRQSSVGGHAVCCVGYNDGPDQVLPSGQLWPHETLLVQNSWGSEWGLKGEYAGCFTLPYAYATSSKLADDFWTIRMVQA